MTLDSGFLTLMFAIVLLDLFDKLYDRYGVKLGPWEIIPNRPIVFGRLEAGGWPKREMRFLFVKIPFVRTWGYIPGKHPRMPDAFGWRTHNLRWIESADPEYGGWRIDPPFEG